jgi:hypothetical protein
MPGSIEGTLTVFSNTVEEATPEKERDCPTPVGDSSVPLKRQEQNHQARAQDSKNNGCFRTLINVFLHFVGYRTNSAPRYAQLQGCPNEIKQKITQYLEGDAKSMTQLAATCKTWHDALKIKVHDEKFSKIIQTLHIPYTFNKAVTEVEQSFTGTRRDRLLTELGERACQLVIKNKDFDFIEKIWLPALARQSTNSTARNTSSNHYAALLLRYTACFKSLLASRTELHQNGLSDGYLISFFQTRDMRALEAFETYASNLKALYEYGPEIKKYFHHDHIPLREITLQYGAEGLQTLCEHGLRFKIYFDGDDATMARTLLEIGPQGLKALNAYGVKIKQEFECNNSTLVTLSLKAGPEGLQALHDEGSKIKQNFGCSNRFLIKLFTSNQGVRKFDRLKNCNTKFSYLIFRMREAWPKILQTSNLILKELPLAALLAAFLDGVIMSTLGGAATMLPAALATFLAPAILPVAAVLFMTIFTMIYFPIVMNILKRSSLESSQ